MYDLSTFIGHLSELYTIWTPEKIQTEIIYALKNPKKNPKAVSRLPIPVYFIARLLTVLYISKNKEKEGLI